MAITWLIDVDGRQKRLRFAYREEPRPDGGGMAHAHTTVKTESDGLSFDGWRVHFSSTTTEVTHLLVVERYENRRGNRVRTHHQKFTVGKGVGTLYLRKKPKGLKGEYAAGDPLAGLWIDFGINEVYTTGTRRIYPPLFTNKHGIRCVTEWVHSPSLVFTVRGDTLKNIPAEGSELCDLFFASSGVEIREEAPWAVVDATVNPDGMTSGHYAILYVQNPKYNLDELRAGIRQYCDEHPSLRHPFDIASSQQEWEARHHG